MNIIKMVGAPRSGTTYIQWLVINNFYNTAVLVSVLGGKHCFPHRCNINNIEKEVVKYGPHLSWQCSKNFKDDLNRNYSRYIRGAYNQSKLKFILCFKDPYSWVVSGMNFRPNQNIEKLIDHWNNFNGAWLSYYDDNRESCFIVRYENLITNLENVLGNMEKKFNLIRSADTFIDSNKHFAPKQTSDVYDKSYYLEERFLEEIDDMDVFRKNLSAKMVERLGYRIR